MPDVPPLRGLQDWGISLTEQDGTWGPTANWQRWNFVILWRGTPNMCAEISWSYEGVHPAHMFIHVCVFVCACDHNWWRSSLDLMKGYILFLCVHVCLYIHACNHSWISAWKSESVYAQACVCDWSGVHVCVFVCVCVHVCVCVCVCMCVCGVSTCVSHLITPCRYTCSHTSISYVCVCVCMCACVRARKCVRVCECARACVSECECMCVCTRVRVYVCACDRVSGWAGERVSLKACERVCVCAYVCMFVCPCASLCTAPLKIERKIQRPCVFVYVCVCVCVCMCVCGVSTCVPHLITPLRIERKIQRPKKKAHYIGTYKRNWTQRNLNAKHSLTTLVCFFVVGAGGYSRIYFSGDSLTTRKMCTVWLHVMVSLHLRYTLSLHTHRHTWVQTKNGKKNVYCLITRDGTSVIKVHTLFTRTRRYSRVHTKRGN